MIEFTIYWPVLRDSNKTPHCPTLWESWENRLIDIAGGFSYAGEASGAWRDSSGRIVRDISRIYRVAIESARESAIFDAIRHYRPLFDQNCVYVAISSENAMIVE